MIDLPPIMLCTFLTPEYIRKPRVLLAKKLDAPHKGKTPVKKKGALEKKKARGQG